MNLYLVRHGEAVHQSDIAGYALTEKGRSDVFKMACFLKKKNIKVDAIWHSTKLRAIQTAEIIAANIPVREKLVEREDMSPNSFVEKVYKEITATNKDLMIVSHLPFLEKLASLLLAGSGNLDAVNFYPGGVVCLERNENKWHIKWALTADLIDSH